MANRAIEKTAEYLGDAVYADVESGMIKLMTWDGLTVQDQIYLEPAVFEALVRFAKARNERGEL